VRSIGWGGGLGGGVLLRITQTEEREEPTPRREDAELLFNGFILLFYIENNLQ